MEPDKEYYQFKAGDHSRLNHSQQVAWETCITQPVSFVWGPPGTGKTRTLGWMSKQFYVTNETVLIVSHANRAVDNALYHTIRSLQDSWISEQELVKKVTRYTMVLLEQIGEVKLKKYEFYERWLRWLKSIVVEKQELEKLVKEYESFDRTIFKAQLADNRLTGLEQKTSQLEWWKQRLQYWMLRLKSPLEDNDQKLNLKRLSKLLVKLSRRLDKTERRLEHLQSQKNDLLEVCGPYRNHKERYEYVFKTVEAMGGIAIVKKQLRRLKYPEQVELLKDKKIIATTLSKLSMNAAFRVMTFDTVIVDEASMAPLPLLVIAACLAKKRIIITGDPQQLPPICLSETEMSKEWLTRDIFAQASGSRSLKGIYRWADTVDYVTFLDTQYRMPVELSAILNEYFYHQKLVDGIDYSDPGALKLIDTTSYSSRCMKDSRGSRYNEVHEKAVFELVRGLVDWGTPQEEIGIITPYRTQSTHIRNLLKINRIEGIEIGTIHTFQGREKDIIIFDVTDSFPMPPGRLLNEEGPDGEEVMRILTVAFSRARKSLYLVAHSSYMISKFQGKILGKIIGQLRPGHKKTKPSSSGERTYDPEQF